MLIATAITARTDLIVSGDLKVLAVGEHLGMRIVNPNEAMLRIDASTEPPTAAQSPK